jgi:hypothetical protein
MKMMQNSGNMRCRLTNVYLNQQPTITRQQGVASFTRILYFLSVDSEKDAKE